MRYAEVVVNTPLRRRFTKPSTRQDTAGAPSRDMTFHYALPSHLKGQVVPGQMVWVPFGPRRMQGIVLELSDSAPVEEVREVEALVAREPFLLRYQLDLARWISRYYLCPLRDAVNAMMPPGVREREEIRVDLVEGVEIPDDLPADQMAVTRALMEEGEQSVGSLGRRLRAVRWRPALDAIVRKGWVHRRSVWQPPRVQPKRVPVAQLAEGAEAHSEAIANAPRQRALMEYLADHGPTPLSDLYKEVGGDRSTVRSLEKKGLVQVVPRELWRDPLAGEGFQRAFPPRLTSDQEAAWREIRECLDDSKQVFLLHGVTGSGKTEIYLRALEDVLASGRQAIVLVPEISLTPQTVRRFEARFPGRIAIFHSGLSLGERYDEWRRTMDGQADVVIGSRSAIFAPLPRLGLIVVDEEHEWAYKQERSPRYHARDVAVRLAEMVGATVILGSATPDLASYYRTQEGSYRLLRLSKRVMGSLRRIEEQRARYDVPMGRSRVRELGEGYEDARYMELPPVQVVDLRQELREGNRSMFSRVLQQAMEETLASGEQAILFINRRGAATFVLCRDCGYVMRCPECQVSLVYHSAEDELHCHQCSFRVPIPDRCPDCGGHRIRYFGVGTQTVEEAVRKRFPGARTLRWDLDVTRRKGSHRRILDEFIRHEADVLIGTQMIAKGLDLPLVTLVGAIAADTALHLPDFRAAERTFQLLAQVAGRAGRSILGGRAVLQTYHPEHYCIQAASRHDYGDFYRHEIGFRREQGYPPFRRLVRLLHVHRDAERCRKRAEEMARVLRDRISHWSLPAVDIIGPAPAFLSRLRGRYRWHILVRAEDPYPLLEGLTFPLGWRVDVDPLNVL